MTSVGRLAEEVARVDVMERIERARGALESVREDEVSLPLVRAVDELVHAVQGIAVAAGVPQRVADDGGPAQ